jgi:hypothetical protein
MVDDDQPNRTHMLLAAMGAKMAGTRADLAVPLPGSDTSARMPVSRLTRWRMPLTPNPGPSLLRRQARFLRSSLQKDDRGRRGSKGRVSVEVAPSRPEALPLIAKRRARAHCHGAVREVNNRVGMRP